MQHVSEFVIQRAERTQARLRIALQGSSGGGKTATSLLLAKGMVEELGRRGLLPSHLECHIGLLDTERDSAKLYAHLVPFDTVVLTPPYTVERYLAALSALERAGYPVIIVDQITHEWHGEGGILQQVQAIQSGGGNEFTAWKKPSELHDQFMDRLLATPAHLIATMRSKTAWVLEEKEDRNGRMKKVPTRIGMQARQREGTEFEFTTVLDLEVGTNTARCIKDRTELFTVGGTVGRMDAEWGRRFMGWVYTAEKPEPAGERQPTPEELVEGARDAGIRACERAANVPDLILAFNSAQTSLRALARVAGRDIVVPAIEALIVAKDRAKASFGAAGGAPAPIVSEPGDVVHPDEVLALEQFLTDADVTIESFRIQFAIPRLAMLPSARWDEAIAWVARVAAGRGRTVDLPRRPAAPAPELSLPEQMEQRVRKIGNDRGGLFAEGDPGASHMPGGFDTMDDDLPFARS